MASRFTALLPAGHLSARPSPARPSPARLPARPPDPLCGLGYSPADPRQSEAEGEVCRHAERLLNMVHAYCEIRDSWTGWLRGSAMSRTLHERIVPEMRALHDAERRIVDQPSVTLLAVLDYAARARQAVPAYTPLATIDYPQPLVSAKVRETCERMIAEAEKAALAARRASAREYAAGMAHAIEREREEEARRRRAMKEAGVTETPAEAEAATDRVEARIAVYQREIHRVYEEADLGPDGEPTDEAVAPEGAREQVAPEGAREQVAPEGAREQVAPEGAREQVAPEGAREQVAPEGAREQVAPEGAREQVAPEAAERSPAADGLTIAWQVHARRWGRTILTPTPETAPRFAERLVLIDRGKRGGTLRAYGGADLNDRRETINGVSFRLRHRRSITGRLRHSLTARLRRDTRYQARLTPAEVQEMRGTRG